MTELRGEPTHSSLWPSYGARSSSIMEPSYSSSSTSLSHLARPRTEHNDHPGYPYRAGYSHDEPEGYDRPATHSSLSSQHSYPNLKRTYSQTETPAYQEIVQDLRDDGSRLTVNQDHKLLAFRRSQDKHTVVDQHGRMQPLELSAQLHGMFFLSEMPSNASDGTALQPELTCYRRNLFQISGSLITPRGQISIVNEAGETVPVSNMEVTISAIESVDGNPVRLIVIPWKTPPPNSPEVTQAPDQEPPSLPLIPFQDDGAEAEGEYAVYPIGWRRLQFRIATANNGRRKELQQHFVLHLKVHGSLNNGSKIVLAESTTAPIVVRGRSPRNFQARKEIPLLGSSAGSRGQALVETGLGVITGSSQKQPETKAPPPTGDMQLPRTAFTFSPPKPPAPQLNSMRSNSYSNWTAPSAASMAQLPASSAGSYPATTIGTDPYPKVPASGGSSFTAESHELPLPTTLAPPVPLPLASNDHAPLRAPYPYVQSTTAPPPMSVSAPTIGSSEPALSIPRYVDNPRPAKSPRHGSQQSVHGSDPVQSNETSSEYRFGSYPASTSDVPPSTYSSENPSSNPPPRDYYPPTSSWTTSAAEHSSQVAFSDARSYSFSSEYKTGPSPSIPAMKSEPPHSAAPPVYGSGPRGSFDGMNNYSWSASG
ncbi:hypothetical protein B0I35DRAFT_409492 [Stachybotrys elegans]|uniref:NDT80 domain-containing protein n=1 Tax=Stachybotrys elegans TaxID=80388 RepID=A0A8K0SWT3_9HYPO|nr:hypothetical protein B0I35DRAFT_409492 [Stachybotrys elegans]